VSMIGAVNVRLRRAKEALMVMFWLMLLLRRNVKERKDGDETMRL